LNQRTGRRRVDTRDAFGVLWRRRIRSVPPLVWPRRATDGGRRGHRFGSGRIPRPATCSISAPARDDR
jgi:hypothetical protein